jgi:hypothetical protein
MAIKLDPIAIYAAILSTAVFCWQIYTWLRSGPRLRGSVSRNMIQFGEGYRDDNLYLVINVANVGKADTTITHVVIFAFDGWWQYFRNRPAKTAVVGRGASSYSIPYVLKPATLSCTWRFRTPSSKNGRVRCGSMAEFFTRSQKDPCYFACDR